MALCRRGWIGLLCGFLAAAGCQRDPGSGAKGSEVTLTFISNNPENFWTIAEAGTKKAAKDFGYRCDFRRPPSGGSSEKQQQIIEDLLTRGSDGIAVSPNDSKNFEPFLKKVSKRVPLVMVDNDVPDPETRRAYVGTHNYRAGRAAGALVKKALPKGGKFAIFVGTLDSTNAIERRQGTLDYLAGIPQDEIKARTPNDAADFKIGDYTLIATKTDKSDSEICFKVAQDFLTTNPDVECLVGLWAYNPPALLRAVKASAVKTKPAIVGFDEDFATLDGITKGDIIGTVVQDPFNFGYQSMKILGMIATKKGDLKAEFPDMTADRSIFIPHRVVTKAAEKWTVDGKEQTTVEAAGFEKELRTILGK